MELIALNIGYDLGIPSVFSRCYAYGVDHHGDDWSVAYPLINHSQRREIHELKPHNTHVRNEFARGVNVARHLAFECLLLENRLIRPGRIVDLSASQNRDAPLNRAEWHKHRHAAAIAIVGLRAELFAQETFFECAFHPEAETRPAVRPRSPSPFL